MGAEDVEEGLKAAMESASPCGRGGRPTLMLGFELSDEHKDVERAVREWAAREVAPGSHAGSRPRFEKRFVNGHGRSALLGVCIPRPTAERG
jgi:hypothetical protein